MQKYSGLQALLDGVVGKGSNEWVSSDIKNPTWDPINATYYIFPEEEIEQLNESDIYVSEEEYMMPKEYAHLQLFTWLEIADIEDVLDYLHEQQKNTDLELKAKSLQYFYKNDAFMEL